MRSEGVEVPKPYPATGRLGPVIAAFLGFSPISMLANLITSVRFVVHGDSMQPNFAGSQYILVSRWAYWRDGLSRGDVVVLRHPRQRNRTYIKRVIGLPGEQVRVEGGRIAVDDRLLDETYLAGKVLTGQDGLLNQDSHSDDVPTMSRENTSEPAWEWVLDEGQYIVLGDNRANSEDSRSFGPLGQELIVGKAWFRYWPRTDWGILTRKQDRQENGQENGIDPTAS